ncbi:MAG: SPOR domain-containing protein [Bradyrhizobium sp.]
MADRYQERRFAAHERDRGDDPREAAGEGDPLAELARLIGQTDQSGAMGRANQQVLPRTSARDEHQMPPRTGARDDYQSSLESEFESDLEHDVGSPVGPPPWLQRANRQERSLQDSQPQDYPSAVHPLQRYPRAIPEPEYQQQPQYAEAPEPDPSRYDDALYGRADDDAQQYQNDQRYVDDPYAYQDDSEDGRADQVQRRRGGGVITVIVILLLAVVGTGAAFAYRTYVGSPRTGEPPIIKADTSPTKVVPTPSDTITKLPDRLASGELAEKIVPREESPVDVNAKAGPRVVFPALNQNGSAPVATMGGSGSPSVTAANGTLPNNEPRKIKTLTVRGDQPDGAAVPITSAPAMPGKQPPGRAAGAAPQTPAPQTPAPRSTGSSASANAAAPMSLVPQGPAPAAAADARTRLADVNPVNPVQTAPGAGVSSAGYLVQVSSQRNEADAQASYRALQGKFPAVLGSHAPVIKRADLGDKGVYYRAMVGPFGSSDEASQFCGNLKSAGGQCVVQRN